MYIFVRKDLSSSQIVVQAAHAAVESARKHLKHDDIHPHFVLLSVNNLDELIKVANKLEKENILFEIFFEPDIGEHTSIATELITDKRHLFKSYKML